MLVAELKEVIKEYPEEDLRLLIVELYKAMPKKLREDKDIDALIRDMHRKKPDKKQEQKKQEVSADEGVAGQLMLDFVAEVKAG